MKTPRSSYRIAPLGIILIALIAFCGVGRAAETENFDVQTLSIPEKILNVTTANYDDIEGAELVVITMDAQGDRHLKIYQQKTNKTYDPVPKATLNLPASVFGIEALDFDKDRRQELFLFALDAVYLLKFEPQSYAEMKQIASFDRLFAIPDPDFVMAVNYVYDLNDDGTPELIVPCWNGARILQKKDQTYILVKQLTMSCKSNGRKDGNLLNGNHCTDFSLRMPSIYVYDLNTDKIKDVVIEMGGMLAIFFQTGKMQFSDRPNRIIEPSKSMRGTTLFASSGLADLNDDHLIDYCRVYTEEIDDDYKTTIEIFFGNIQEGYSQLPSKTIVLNRFAVGLSLVDLDNSGSEALVVATEPVSPTSMVKALLVKGMPVELHIFASEGGVIADDPVTVKKFNCGVDFINQKYPTRYIGCLTADVDHDKRSDLVVVTDDDEMQVFSGGKNPIFADKPSIIRKAAGIRSIDSAGLNGERHDDLILQGVGADGSETITLLRPK